MVLALTLADPERALALAYVPHTARKAVLAVWAFDEQLGAAVVRGGQGAAAQLRLAWWRDALLGLRKRNHVDPVLQALADELSIDPAVLLPLIDGWDALLDPLPLQLETLGHYAEQRGAVLFKVTAGLLGDAHERLQDGGRRWALVDLAFRVTDRDTAVGALELASNGSWRWPRRLRALGVLDALAAHDRRRGLGEARQLGSPRRVARAMLMGLFGF